MPAIKKADNNIRYGDSAVVSDSVKSHANDPFVVKKNEEAKKAVSKLTLPGSKKK